MFLFQELYRNNQFLVHLKSCPSNHQNPSHTYKLRAQKGKGGQTRGLTELGLFASMNVYGGNQDPKGTG